LYAAIPPLVQQFRQTVYALAVLIGKTPESIDVDTARLTELNEPGGDRRDCRRNCCRAGRTSPRPSSN
jgi:hypothetical protein